MTKPKKKPARKVKPKRHWLSKVSVNAPLKRWLGNGVTMRNT